MQKDRVRNLVFILSALLTSSLAHAKIEVQIGVLGNGFSSTENDVGLFSGSQTRDTDNSSVPGGPAYNFGGNVALFFTSWFGLRTGYNYFVPKNGSGTVVFNGGGGGSAGVKLGGGSYVADLIFRFHDEKSGGFYFGAGALQHKAQLDIAYSLSNPAGTVRSDTLHAEGENYGYRGLLGYEIYMGKAVMSLEAGYQYLKIDKLNATSAFNYAAAGNPNAGISPGGGVQKWVSNSPNGFRGENIRLDLSGPMVQFGFGFRF